MPDPPARASLRETLLHPRLWPVRWRLTGVSAILTFLILVTFALVVGNLVSSRLHHDFDTELTQSAAGIAVQVPHAQTLAGPFEDTSNLNLRHMTAPPAGLRIVSPPAFDQTRQTRGFPSIGLPSAAGLSHLEGLDIATVQVPEAPGWFVQYARSTTSVDATVDKLWLFLLAGVLGGTLLATLAGLAVASRAMRPIAALTATAREIATTRDPSRRVPRPESDDEVAELALTLDQMLRELDAARNETDQMIQAQREFVADASHELRTPLTSILANLELLQARLDAVERKGEEGEIIDGALRSSRRMSRLVSDLLLLAKADAGRMGMRRPCDLAEVAEAAVAEVRPVADDHQIAIEAPAAVPILGNADELHRVVLNLLDNAVRHTPAGTSVLVSISRQGPNAVLEVADDGPGLPAGMEEQIFARFVRGSGPADLSSNGGTGLGLAIVQAVAATHGGTVEAGPSAHGGARFTVRVPSSSGEPEAPAGTPSEAGANL